LECCVDCAPVGRGRAAMAASRCGRCLSQCVHHRPGWIYPRGSLCLGLIQCAHILPSGITRDLTIVQCQCDMYYESLNILICTNSDKIFRFIFSLLGDFLDFEIQDLILILIQKLVSRPRLDSYKNGTTADSTIGEYTTAPSVGRTVPLICLSNTTFGVSAVVVFSICESTLPTTHC